MITLETDKIYSVSEASDIIEQSIKRGTCFKTKQLSYYNSICAFDIETTNYKSDSGSDYKNFYLYQYLKGVNIRVFDVTPIKHAHIHFSRTRGINIDEYYAELCELFPGTFKPVYDEWQQMNNIIRVFEDNQPFNEDAFKVAVMYCWQLAIDGKVIFGRTWQEFLDVIGLIHQHTSTKTRILIYVHNLAFEFQFMRCLLTWHKVFSIAPRKPIYAITEDGIEFRCSYILTNYSLQKLAEQLHTYKIEKLVGDLDYNLDRTPLTPMTWEEIRYCINDVLILNAYIQEQVIIERFISYIPLTATGYCRRYARKMCLYGTDKNKRNDQYNKYHDFMSTLQITGVDEYKQLKRAFSGGFTHCSAYWSGIEVDNSKYGFIDSIDFTSSYPFVCLSSPEFPMSTAQEVIPKDRADFEHYLKYYWCMFDVEFIGIYPTFINENYISASHCYTKEKCVTNNGRVVSADRIRLTITHIDFDIIRRTYKWDGMTVKNMRIYKKGYLPKELIMAIIKLYKDKTKLKGVPGKEQEYQNAKALLNAIYGMMVTDISKDEVIYSDTWDVKEADLEHDIKKYNSSNKRFLFYPWGVHIVKEATRNLWLGIMNFCNGTNDYIYSDTDSIKCLNMDKHMEFIRAYNAQCIKKLKLMCKRLDIDYSELEPKTIKGEVKPLGIYDHDGHYTRFKSLGAKRYMVEQDGKINITVSGVNKRVAVPYLLDKYGKDIFKAFNTGLEIPAGKTGKLTHVYIDSFQSGTMVDYNGIEWKYNEQPPGVYLEAAAYYFDVAMDYIEYVKGVQYTK